LRRGLNTLRTHGYDATYGPDRKGGPKDAARPGSQSPRIRSRSCGPLSGGGERRGGPHPNRNAPNRRQLSFESASTNPLVPLPPQEGTPWRPPNRTSSATPPTIAPAPSWLTAAKAASGTGTTANASPPRPRPCVSPKSSRPTSAATCGQTP